ncbi:major facilitator superfamily domain-containing protein 1-like [Pecten maximus]|uniref:major facilitator superfamily domain-containing protein 1-like n=1 Tax=Pecten maximus TaxID=6579 RepID=UPI001457FE44|nr:major facilitator superfamily domain-containing protein 1-like [Pecten maximus]XP_033733514.1 major facilitator superfamily domain-containing protein 1-like [Pecten maximus]
MDAAEWKTRYILLIFACFLPFGCYFNIDVLGALQKDLQGIHTGNCSNHTANMTCCTDCLGLGPDRYNQLYAAYSWMNAVSALPGGYFIDKIGYRGSAILTTTVASLGTLLFAVSVTDSIRTTSAMFPLMFCGRLLLGAGTSPALIVQNRILASWFPDNILVVFSLMVVVLRLGNVSNFFLTANIASWIGLSRTLWISMLVFVSICLTSK